MMENYLKKYRETARLTQSQIAEKVGCARETIANLERGKYNPSLLLAYKIINALNESQYMRFPAIVTDVFPNEDGI